MTDSEFLFLFTLSWMNRLLPTSWVRRPAPRVSLSAAYPVTRLQIQKTASMGNRSAIKAAESPQMANCRAADCGDAEKLGRRMVVIVSA